VAGGWRRLNNEELHNLYGSSNVIRVIKSRGEMGRAYSMHGRDNNFIKNIVGKPEGRRPVVRPRHRWVENTGMDLG
jgi:hypothetical protein